MDKNHRQSVRYEKFYCFFRAIVDLLDVLDRGDIRTELLKAVECQQQNCCYGVMRPTLLMIESTFCVST
ncbi:MAG: cell division protein ZapD [Candidatus Malihini olakiniferum]